MTMRKLYIIFLKVFLIIVLTNLKAISDEKIKIGLIVPLSGEYSYIGKSILKSTRMALDKINDERITIIPKDTKANPVQAKEARDYLNSLIAGKDVDIRRITKDKYGRTVAELSINGINVQRNMVTKGYAKIYSKYAYQCPWIR